LKALLGLPIALLYGDSDVLSAVEDVKWLIE
jgi:hypothetical protein